MNTAVISPVNVTERAELDLRVGDTVRVHQKIKEASGKTRIQIFEGMVLARKHGREAGGSFTVRRTSGGYGVEKIFPLYSPMIDKIEIVRRSKVRQSKLYYIREKAAREIKRQMRRMTLMYSATEGETEAKARVENEEKLAAEAKDKEAEALAAQSVEKTEAKVADVDSDGVVEADRPEQKEVADKAPTDLQEDMEEASTEEVKEQINEDTPDEEK